MPRKILLWLPSVIYGAITALRNRLYDLGIFRSRSFPLPVICVGNITVGGTGKTPHVIYLAGKLSVTVKVAVLSRGYLRKSMGFRPVRPDDSVGAVGDEPLLMARRMAGARVYVDRNRVHGITEILRTAPATGAIILDDGFQHRAVKAGMNILLTSYDRLMIRDSMMPSGRLRESLQEIKRADMVIVTKAPQGITRDEMAKIKSEMSLSERQALFFTALRYGNPLPLFDGAAKRINKTTSVLLVTGIADPAPLSQYLSDISAGVKHLSFHDHHWFSAGDISRVTTVFETMTGNDKMIITTEKDGVRLKEIANIADHVRQAFYCLPVDVEFIENEDDFIRMVYGNAGKDRTDG